MYPILENYELHLFSALKTEGVLSAQEKENFSWHNLF